MIVTMTVIVAAVMVAVVVVFAKIAVPVVVPVMVVVAPAGIACPVSMKIALSIVTRRHPLCTGISRAGPVSGMPFIMVSHRKPIAFHPKTLRGWAGRHDLNLNHARRRRRVADYDADGNLAERGCSSQEH